jgi:hypothetical protein
VIRRHSIPAAACLVAALAGGCAGPKKPDGDGRASSLVYSPSERLPPDRDARDTGGSPTAAAPPQEDPVRPPAGRRCRVHFRREAMGVAGQAPYPLSGNNLATDRAQVTGTLERVGRDWLVIRGERSTYWVPREAVLAVEFADQ